MPSWLTWLVALALLVAESAFLAALGFEALAFQTPVVLTMFLALRRGFVGGALVLAALLVPAEWLVVGPSGYYSLGLVVVFLLFHVARGYVDSKWGVTQVFLAALAVCIHAGVMAVAMAVFEPSAIGLETFVWGAVTGAIGGGIIVWPLGRMLERLDGLASRRSESSLRLSSGS